MVTAVSTQLERIEGGKDSLINSIENKGVAVPDDATIDALSPYVDAIVTANLQSNKAPVTPTTAQQTITPDSGYDGMTQVVVNAMPSGSCTVAGGGLSGGSAVTPTVTLSNGSDTNLDTTKVTVGEKDTTNYPYYFKVSGASSSGSSKVTRAAVTDTHEAGYIPAKAKTNVIASTSKTVTVNAGSGSTYVGLKAGACTVSGGVVSVTNNYSGTPTVDITLDGQTTSGAAITTTKPSSGYYLTLGASSSALSGTTKVTRAAVTDTHTAGYIPAKSATTVISSTTASPTVTVNKGTKTKYITLPSATVATPTMNITADDEESEICVRALNTQGAGYTSGGTTWRDAYVKLAVNGDTATMSCGNASISRKVGANIATCTVNIRWSTTPEAPIITATTFANGAISVFTTRTSSGTVTIPNVVCGSVVTVHTGTMTSVYGWSYGKTSNQYSYTHALTIPASTGTYTAEIGEIDD